MMTNSKLLTASVHENIIELIPWYVKDKLTSAEKELVNKHLQTCENCRNEVVVCQKTMASLPQSALTWKPSPAHFAGIMAEVDKVEAASSSLASKSKQKKGKINWLSSLGSIFSHTPSSIKWTLALESIAIAGLVLFLVLPITIKTIPTNSFETLSSDESKSSQNTSSIILVLADDMTAKELTDLLRETKAQLQSGPSETGVYTVTVESAASDNALRQFKTHVKVRLALLHAETPVKDR
jgi:hypothetical protein